MKLVVLDYERGEVDIIKFNKKLNDNQIEKYLRDNYGDYEQSIEYMTNWKKELVINYV